MAIHLGLESVASEVSRDYLASMAIHTLTAERFTEIGESLYGRRWKTQLAEKLGIDRATVHRYASGARRVPCDVAEEMKLIARASAGKLRAVR
jgi:hypothetical protein